VDDIVEGILRAWGWLQRGEITDSAYQIFNLGRSHPVPLIELIHLLETALGCMARLDWQPDQPGDVPQAYADLRKSEALLGYRPQVDIVTGLQRFATWFRAYDQT
jgi:UDP-glucuronate 4-epimerase